MADKKEIKAKLGDVVEVTIKRRKRRATTGKPEDRRYGPPPILDEETKRRKEGPFLAEGNVMYNMAKKATPKLVPGTSIFANQFGIGDRYAYVKSGSDLDVYYIGKPKILDFVAGLTIGINALVYSANVVYAVQTSAPTSGTDLLRIIDVSTPSAPSEISNTNLNANLFTVNQKSAGAIRVDGTLAYVSNNDFNPIQANRKASYICIYDVSNPMAVTQVGNYQTHPAANSPATTYWSGLEIYAGHTYSIKGDDLMILDATTPSAITLAATFNVATATEQAGRFLIKGDRLFILFGDDDGITYKVKIYDISTPASPMLLFTYTETNKSLGFMYVTDDGYLFISGSDDSGPSVPGFQVININGAPSLVTFKQTSASATTMVVVDKKGFLA